MLVRMIGELRTGGVPAMATKHGVSTLTLYPRRCSYSRVEVRQVSQLRQQRRVNAKLKTLMVKRDLILNLVKEGPKRSRVCALSLG